MGLLPDYSRQAKHYDETRSASPSVLRALREALKGAPGRRLADIGGGTGNYTLALAREGWEPVVVDRSAAMLAWAAAKELETVEADAQRLPFEDETFDAVTMISMLHHVEDRGVALAEARRILRPRGLLVLMGYTGEDAATLWILDYFPSSRRWMEATHPPRAAILEELPGARLFAFEFEDTEDASLAALSADPESCAGGCRKRRDELLRADVARPSRGATSRGCATPRGHRGRPGPETCRDGDGVQLDQALADTRARAPSKRPHK